MRMKKERKRLYALAVLITLAVATCSSESSSRQETAESLILMTEREYSQLLSEIPGPGNSGMIGCYPAGSAVDRNGTLQVRGVHLCDENGNNIQLKGLYLRSLGDEAKYLNDGCFATLVNRWKINVLRIPFMSYPWFEQPSYIGSRHYEQMLDKAVSLCEKYGIYCIIDWHVLGDGNPFLRIREAVDFFKRVSYRYGAKEHMLYEICNEPNGKEVTWNEVIKRYAQLMIPVIRAAAPESVVITGTGTWSQDVDIAAMDPLSFSNVMYSFHFYSGTHGKKIRDRVRIASYKIPLFSTEWGNSDCSGNGRIFLKESAKWLAMMEERGISWCHFSLSDTTVSASMLRENFSARGGWTRKELTSSGRFVLDYFY